MGRLTHCGWKHSLGWEPGYTKYRHSSLSASWLWCDVSRGFNFLISWTSTLWWTVSLNCALKQQKTTHFALWLLLSRCFPHKKKGKLRCLGYKKLSFQKYFFLLLHRLCNLSLLVVTKLKCPYEFHEEIAALCLELNML